MASQQTLKRYFYNYLSQSDTGHLESAQEKKKGIYSFEKTTKVVLQGLSPQWFLQKQSMILRKVLFTLFDDSFMYEDLPLLIK